MHRLWRLPAFLVAATAVISFSGCSKQPVAIVNGERVTRQEFNDRLEETGGERVLADLIVRRMFAAAFTKYKIEVTDKELNDQLDQEKKRMGGAAAFQAALGQQGLTEAKLREMIKFDLQSQKLATRDVKYTEADLQKFFGQYRDKFGRPETVVLSEIVVTDKAKAAEVRGQLNAPKASFPTLARTFSMSAGSRDRGGRRPEEPLAGIQPQAIRDVVAKLQVGQISQPIAADGLFYIIRLDERHAAEAPDYAKVKEDVRRAYLMNHGKSRDELIEELRKVAKVTITDKRYSKLNQLFGPQQQLPTFGAQGAQKGQAPATAPGGKAAPAGTPAPAGSAPATGAPAPAGAAAPAPAPAPAAPAPAAS